MTPNRIVAVLTPLVFAPLAGAIAAWLAEHFPGVEVDQSSLEQIFIAGALIALAPAAQWLHGWQKHEARQAELERDVLLAGAAFPTVAPTTAHIPSDEAALDFDELAEADASSDVEQPDEFEELDDLDDAEFTDDEADDEFADDELLADEAFEDEFADDELLVDDELDEELLDDEEPATAGS